MAVEELTLKQRKFVKAYLETGNASQAALKAGYKCRESGSDNISNPIIKAAFQELLDNAGLTDKKISKCLEEGLAAVKIQNVNIVLKHDQAGNLEVQDTDDFIEVADYAVRHKYLETLLKLKQKTGIAELDPVVSTPIETYLIEFVKSYNGRLKEQGADGLKIIRTEHRALDKFLAK